MRRNVKHLDTLSIDSIYYQLIVNTLWVITIFLSIISKKREVLAFLDELGQLLGKEDFDINSDLILIRKKKKNEDVEYSTPYTLLELNYDVQDVVDRLKELKVEEYSETKIDVNDLDPPLLFVFGKGISDKLVYVKLKIRNQNKQVLCVSFHYAKDKMEFPYAQ